MGTFKIMVHHKGPQRAGRKILMDGESSATAIKLPPTTYELLIGTNVHTCSKAAPKLTAEIQDNIESVCGCNGLDWSQLGLGKHADSLAFITEALNLSSAIHKYT